MQAAQYAGRHEWKQKCADLIHVLGGFLEARAYWDDAIAAHTLAVQAGRDLIDPARVAAASNAATAPVDLTEAVTTSNAAIAPTGSEVSNHLPNRPTSRKHRKPASESACQTYDSEDYSSSSGWRSAGIYGINPFSKATSCASRGM